MSIRHLDSLFDPRSVAVIGASEQPASVGATVWRNLRAGGFAGPRWAVNPKHSTLAGEAVYADVADLPEAPDLAVICTPPATVPALIEALGARGTRAAIVLTAGLDAAQKQAMLQGGAPAPAAHPRPELHRPAVAACGLNASFAHTDAPRRQPGLRLAVGRAGHRGARLGQRARHRLFALRLARRACRRRLRRPARLPGQRRAARARSCSTSSRSRRRASSCRRRARRRATSR